MHLLRWIQSNYAIIGVVPRLDVGALGMGTGR
jgi:hypothetical protein